MAEWFETLKRKVRRWRGTSTTDDLKAEVKRLGAKTDAFTSELLRNLDDQVKDLRKLQEQRKRSGR